MDPIENVARRLERAMGGIGPPGRDASAAILCARLGIDRRTRDLRHGLRRGRCRRRGCESRYAAVRVTVDTRDPERTDRSATLECALCGHVWGAATVPELRLHDGGLPRILVTLILPPLRGEGVRIGWTRRGRAIRSGSDALLVREATYAQLVQALAEHRERNARATARREAALAKRDAAEAADIAEARAREAAIVAAQRARLAANTALLQSLGSPIA